MKILFFGDIVAKLGRQAVAKVLPKWKKDYQPDAIIGNVENLAHGNGFTKSTLDELTALGFDGFTSGDHAFKTAEAETLLTDKSWLLARPANFPPGVSGRGYWRLKVGSKDLVVINLIGRVFMEENYDDPFRIADTIINEFKNDGDVGGILVDFHAEATSEKVALGWYLDGRASAVLGTHTHVATRDERLLPGGTSYITDVGMTGSTEGVIGVKKEIVLERFLKQTPARFEPVEAGPAVVQAVLVDISSPTKANSIQYLKEELTI